MMTTALEIYDQNTIDQKLEPVRDILRDRKVLVAFSGGVDSSVVAYLAKRYARKTKLVMQVGLSVAIGEKEIAQKQAKQLGLPLLLLEYDEVDYSDEYANNPDNRCYFCKELLFKFIDNLRVEEDYDLILSGTNVSDLKGHRPGHKAAREAGVLDPLVLANFTKQEVRWIAQHAGLLVWDKPATACLASRFVTGERISKKALQQVAHAEYYIKSTYEVKILRVRHHGDLARIEVGANELQRLMDPKIFQDINAYLKSLGYRHVTLDLEGYRPYTPNNAGIK